jgi:GNAT superfamily N-acetyltransferase
MGSTAIGLRVVTEADVSAISECRLRDPEGGPADPRMAAYFRGEHHPQRALLPRTGYAAFIEGTLAGYIAGHLTTRHGCEGEVQYLFVASPFRRRGVASALLRSLAAWFRDRGAKRVCVSLDAESPAAQPFYRALGAHPLSPERKLWYIWDDIGVLLKGAPEKEA